MSDIKTHFVVKRAHLSPIWIIKTHYQSVSSPEGTTISPTWIIQLKISIRIAIRCYFQQISFRAAYQAGI